MDTWGVLNELTTAAEALNKSVDSRLTFFSADPFASLPSTTVLMFVDDC
jgi:hypothetical protein